MKALSMWQPWAELAARGLKHYETRARSISYRGTLAIYATKAFPDVARQALLTWEIGGALAAVGINHLSDLTFGTVIATCDLVDCVLITAGNVPLEPERSFGDYTPGRYMWRLTNVRRLAQPILARGMPGLWNWDPPPPGERYSAEQLIRNQ